MEEKIKQCKALTRSICSCNYSPAKMDDLIKTVKQEGDVSPSSFVKMVIASLLTLCDTLYLNNMKVFSHTTTVERKKWYDISFLDTERTTKHYVVMKNFLLDLYYDEDEQLEERFASSQGRHYTVLTLKDTASKQKYAITLHEPPADKATTLIVAGMCKAFERILPSDVCTQIAVGGILYRNLLSLLN